MEGPNALDPAAVQHTRWRIVFKPSLVSTGDDNNKPVSWKTLKPLDYSLPTSLNRWLSSWLNRWRPLLSTDDQGYVFLNKDGSAPVTSIRPVVVSLVRELTGQITPPHMFRTITVTHVYNSSSGNQDVLAALAETMATSVDILKRNYVMVDRLAASAKAQAAIDHLLSTPIKMDSDSANIVQGIPEHAAVRLTTATKNFNNRLTREVRPQRPVDGTGKRTRIPWTVQEEAALVKAVSVHGEGQWALILAHADYAHILTQRSNVDLKDKWRSLSRIKRARSKRIAVEAVEKDDSDDELELTL